MWYDMTDFTHVQYQANSLSDHTPIVLDFPACPRPNRTFMFCDMWAKDYKFLDIVKAQTSQQKPGSALRGLQQLLTKLRKPFRELNRMKYADIYAQQVKARSELVQIQQQLHGDPGNKDLIAQEDIQRNHYVTITASALALMKQQSKAEWIGFGDECSRQFMAKIKQRKAQQCIYQLKDTNGQWAEGFEQVADIMTAYYQTRLGRQDQPTSTIDKDIINQGHSLTLDQQIDLCKPFDDKEIKSALFSIPNHKSPGPDGFNSGFYKASWEVMGPYVCSAIQEFF